MSRPRARHVAYLLATAVIALVSFAGYLAASKTLYGFGFPLDDAWIHQTYARNLACCGEWAFVPGDPSGGSTAPLWSLGLSLGHALGLGPLPSGYGLGMAAWLALAWCCAGWFALRNPGVARWPWVIGALVLVEWHLAWSAVSGMETLLFALLVVAVFVLLDARASWLAVGALVGLTVWVRPDALTLLLPVALHLGLRREDQGERGWRGAAWFVVGLALLIVPYFGFNAALAGSIFPSTLAAKTAEYASLRNAPFLQRLLQQMALPLVGLLAVLLPGMLVAAWRAGRGAQWTRLAPLAWAAAYLAAFALRLPVVYQHGRYAMPTIPVLLVLGMEGMSVWAQIQSPVPARRILSRVWSLTLPAVALIFWVLGARAYAQDVAIIETEMVAAARWIQGNTPTSARIAAHDVGALGYFGNRQILDMAGLTSEEAIPILRDEAALYDWLEKQGADYLMTFPSWYPWLTTQANIVFQTDGSYAPAAGGENMAIYSWGAR
jgi:arabinofuranosyltransferase